MKFYNTIVLSFICFTSFAFSQPKDLENFIYESINKDNKNILIPEGEYIIKNPIVITQSGITISGNGNVIIKSQIKGKDMGVLWFKGNTGKKIGYSILPIKKGDSVVYSSKIFYQNSNGKYILIRYPNTPDFLEKISSKSWNKEFPYLRQGIYEVKDINFNKIILNEPVEIDYPENAEIWLLNPLEDIKVENLTIIQEIPNADKEEVKYVYENLYPDYAVDAIKLEYVANSIFKNLKVRMAGRHVFNCEFCYKVYVENFEADGSWNKGKGGNGYFKVSKTFNSYFNNIKLENIRHLTIQWMSAKNIFTNLDLKVDINFHGGYTRYNTVRNCRIYIPKEHLWNPITRTPNDAQWAPPDGEENIVDSCKITEGK